MKKIYLNKDPIKFFGYELGVQEAITNDMYVIKGSHDESKLISILLLLLLFLLENIIIIFAISTIIIITIHFLTLIKSENWS